jgi:hypothetical protein
MINELMLDFLHIALVGLLIYFISKQTRPIKSSLYCVAIYASSTSALNWLQGGLPWLSTHQIVLSAAIGSLGFLVPLISQKQKRKVGKH